MVHYRNIFGVRDDNNNYSQWNQCVSIQTYTSNELINKDDILKDYENLTTQEPFFSSKTFNRFVEIRKEQNPDRDIAEIEKEVADFSNFEIPTLKPEVLQWLEENILPFTEDGKVQKGWIINSKEDRKNMDIEVSLFFYRFKDARRFIRKFSLFKKPTEYYNYFSRNDLQLNQNWTLIKKTEAPTTTEEIIFETY